MSNKPFNRDDAYKTLETINMWINNCDTKASIVLSGVGVITTVFLSSDFAKIIKRTLENAISSESSWKILYIVCFTFAVGLSVAGLILFISCLTPKIINKPINQSNARSQTANEIKSIMFYAKIAAKKYEEYEKEVKDMSANFDSVMKDLTWQIHSAAYRCNLKFNKFKKGIWCFTIGFAVCVFLLIVGYYSF